MLTQETKQAIVEAYLDKSNKVEDIAQKFGVIRAQVSRIAVEMGAEPRRAKTFGKHFQRDGSRVCPKCKKSIDVKGAKFCCFCGTDIRDAKELLIERVEKAFAHIQFLPVNARDEVQQLFVAIIDELKIKEKAS